MAITNNAIRIERLLPLIDANAAYSLVGFYRRGYFDGAKFWPDPMANVGTSQVFGSGNTISGTSVVHGLLATLISNIGTQESLTSLAHLSIGDSTIDVGSVYIAQLQGQWQATTVYALNDIVFTGQGWNFYQCVLGNTASSLNGPPNATYWTLITPTVLSQASLPSELTLTDLNITGMTGAINPLRIAGHSALGPPKTGPHRFGDVFVDHDTPALWLCLISGTPGAYIPLFPRQPFFDGNWNGLQAAPVAPTLGFSAGGLLPFAPGVNTYWAISYINTGGADAPNDPNVGVYRTLETPTSPLSAPLVLSSTFRTATLSFAAAPAGYDICIYRTKLGNLMPFKIAQIAGSSTSYVDNGSVTSASFIQPPVASAYRGLVSLGNGDFFGVSQFFSGSVLGTLLAGNMQPGFAGNLIDLQVAGVSKFKVDASGNVTANNLGSGQLGFYGDGSDGSVTFDGSTTILGMAPAGNVYTMVRDLYLAASTINNGVSLKTNGFRLFCNGVLTNNGTIHWNGNNATGTTTNAGAGFASSNSSFGAASGAGGVGATAVSGGSAGIGPGNSYGGTGGAGGKGSTGAGGGAGGTTSAPNATDGALRDAPAIARTYLGTPGAVGSTIQALAGGGGGGGGAGDATNGGGAGGGGAGIVPLLVYQFAGTGNIQAIGGNGFTPTVGNVGGGGPGGGGCVAIVSNSISGGAIAGQTISVAAGTPGTRHGTGSQTNGGTGANGTIILCQN